MQTAIIKILGNSLPKNKPVKVTDPVTIIRNGLPSGAAMAVISYLELPDAQAERVFGFSLRTLERRHRSRAVLTLVQSDRVYRVARVCAHAEAVFQKPETAKDWLKTPNRALGGATPLDLLDTDAGAEQVEEVLYRVEHGIYS